MLIVGVIIMCLYNILNLLFNILNFKFDNNSSMELIGFEVSLVSIYFIFLPFIIQDKKDEFYLGHNVKRWILYDRVKKNVFTRLFSKFNLDNLYSSISISFYITILLIVISVFFQLANLYIFVLLIFFVFILFLANNVITYLELTSNETYNSEIESNFVYLVQFDKRKICDMLENTPDYAIVSNRKTIEFILQHYGSVNMREIYELIYKKIMKTRDSNNIFILFSEISKELGRRAKNGEYINIYINPWDVNFLLCSCTNELNVDEIASILHMIIINQIKLSFKDNNNYNEILSISYDGILNNNSLKNETKNRLFDIIFSSINYEILINKDKENDYIRYKYIVNLFKRFIDIRDKNGIRFMKTNIRDNIDDRNPLYFYIWMTLMIYLFYLIKVEKGPFVDEEEKNYLKQVHSELKKLISDNFISYVMRVNIDELFDWIKKVSVFWERYFYDDFKKSCVKTPMVDKAIIISMRSLFIVFKYGINNRNCIGDNDLKAFRFTIEEGKLNSIIQEEIYDFIDFASLEVNDNMILTYINALMDYAKFNLNKELNSYKNIDFFKTFFNELSKQAYIQLKNLPVFNRTKMEKTNTFNDEWLLDRQTSFDVLKREYLEHNVLESNVEEKIFELLSKNDFKQICYYYDSEEKIVKKLCSLRKSYYYIRPKFDNLGEDYKFGDRYNDCISKFKIMDTLVNKKRFIVDKYNCELKKITFEINEVPDDIIKDIIKQYKKGRNYYVKDSYGLELKCSRKEIIDYCKRKYLFCVLSFDIAIDFDKTKGYEFVYKKECDNENKNS